MRSALQRKRGNGGVYSLLLVSVAIAFGGTNLHIRIKWEDQESSCSSVLVV